MFPTPRSCAAPTRSTDAILTCALVFLAFLPALLLPATELSATETPPGPPEVELADLPLSDAEATADLGTLIKGRVLRHTFTLESSGSEPIAFERAIAGPGCSVISFDRSIASGGTGTVEVELDTSDITGKASCVTAVFAPGHEAPAALLTLEFRVEPRLLAHPGYARWIYVQHEPQGTIRQTVYSTDGSEFEVTAVRSPVPSISTSFRPALPEERREDKPGSQWVVEATLATAAPIGPLRGRLEIETTHPEQKTLEIPVSGFVRPVLFVQPPAGRFGTMELTAPRPALFDVRNFATAEIRLTGASTDLPGATARIQPVQEGRRYRVEVVFDPARMEPGPFTGTLTIATDSEKMPSLEVPLSGELVRPAADG